MSHMSTRSVAVCRNVLQCVAMCCSVLQCAAVCCKVLQGVAGCCRVLQFVAGCCIVWQCFCSSLLCVAVHFTALLSMRACVHSSVSYFFNSHQLPFIFMHTHTHTHTLTAPISMCACIQGGFAGDDEVQAATISCNLNAAQCFLKLSKS